MKFNPDEDHVIVGGRHPLKYLQGGHGFTVSGDHLGEFDAQGEPVAAKSRQDKTDDEFVPAKPPALVSDRQALEAMAADLGIAFRSNISDEKLKERIEAAKNDLS